MEALVAFGLYSAVFTAVGLSFALRYSKGSIRCRSPALILVSHAALLGSAALVCLEIFNFDRDLGSAAQSARVVLYFAYCLPYLLRCYRLSFIFDLQSFTDESDSYFMNRYYRATQVWLLKVFIVMMLPVFVVAGLVLTFPDFGNYVPLGEDRNWVSNSIYIGVSFLEELVFIGMVFRMRYVFDPYKMSRELYLICIIRSCTSFCVLLPDLYWNVAVVTQNSLIMLVSSLWPFVLSFRNIKFNDSMTYEVLENMELILLNASALNAFEEFIRILPEDDRTHGENLLQLWYRISMYSCTPRESLTLEIAELERKCFINCEPNMQAVKEQTLSTLNNNFFQRFRKSTHYLKLLKEIKVMEVFHNRIVMTSIANSDSVLSESFIPIAGSTFINNRL